MGAENTKNRREQGGERWVVEGVLDIVGAGQLQRDGVPVDLGTGFVPAAAQANSTATEVEGLVTDFNALLAKLRAAGLMET